MTAISGQLRAAAGLLRPSPALLVDAVYVTMLGFLTAVAWGTHLGSPWRQLVLAYAGLEALWLLFGKWRLHQLGQLTKELPKTDNFERVWERFMELQAVFGIEEFLQGWFLGADPSLVRRENLEEFVAYAFFNQRVDELSPRDYQRVGAFLAGVERAWGVSFPPGRTPGLKYMGWLWEPLRVYHKPLALYGATEAAGRMAQFLLWAMGFQRGSTPAGGMFNYWLWTPPPPGARRRHPATLLEAVAAAAEEGEELRGLCSLTKPLGRHSRGGEDAGRGDSTEEGSPEQPASPVKGRPSRLCTNSRRRGRTSSGGSKGQGVWQRSLAAAAEELWGLRGELDQVAESALDAAVTVAGTAAAAVAAQYPHRGPAAQQGPWSPPPAARAPSSPLPAAGAAVPIEAAAGAAAAASQRAQSVPAAGALPSPQQAAALAAEPLQEQQQQQPIRDGQQGARPRGVGGAGRQGRGRAVQRQHAPPAWRGDSTDPRADDGVVHVTAAAPISRQPAAGAAWGLHAAQPAGGRPGSRAKSGVPIVFLHGVGFGMLPYLHFVRDLVRACPQSPVIMLEVRHVALRLCWQAETIDDVAHAVAAVLRQHGYTKACLTGHSYGTFCISRICQLYPEMVHSVAVIDPVCMLTCYPQLLYNFIYKAPTLASLKNPMAVIDLARYVCSRDLTIAQAFCRKFQWHELMLWPQDLPPRSAVVLSGRDDLVPAELVMAQLKLSKHPAKVMYHPGLGHGGMLIAPKWQAEVVATIRQLVVEA